MNGFVCESLDVLTPDNITAFFKTRDPSGYGWWDIILLPVFVCNIALIIGTLTSPHCHIVMYLTDQFKWKKKWFGLSTISSGRSSVVLGWFLSMVWLLALELVIFHSVLLYFLPGDITTIWQTLNTGYSLSKSIEDCKKLKYDWVNWPITSLSHSFLCEKHSLLELLTILIKVFLLMQTTNCRSGRVKPN